MRPTLKPPVLVSFLDEGGVERQGMLQAFRWLHSGLEADPLPPRLTRVEVFREWGEEDADGLPIMATRNISPAALTAESYAMLMEMR